jgi:hypothetical protein
LDVRKKLGNKLPTQTMGVLIEQGTDFKKLSAFTKDEITEIHKAIKADPLDATKILETK